MNAVPVAALAGFAFCVLLIAAGAALIAPAAGLIAAGVLGLPLVYAWAYIAVRRPPAPPKPDGP